MKIAIDCRMIGSSGIGVYIEELLPFFVQKCECLLFGNKQALTHYFDKAEIVECNVKVFSLQELFSFPKSLLKKINTCDFYYTPYCNIPCGIKIPIYSTIHDIVFLDIKGLTNSLGVFIRKMFYWRAIKKSLLLFTVSNFSKERIEKHFNCKNLPIVVTYPALSKKILEAQKKLLKNDSTNAVSKIKKQKQILYVGNIKKHKGLSILLDAFRIAQAQGLTSKLVIVGNAENFRSSDKSIAKKINEFPKDAIQFTGYITDDELIALYISSSLLVQPSLYEGFGLPPLEAMSLGTRALISDILVFREVYGSFPVVFFKSGDANDLARKIISCTSDLSPVPKLPLVYSFEKTANIIFNSISTSKVSKT